MMLLTYRQLQRGQDRYMLHDTCALIALSHPCPPGGVDDGRLEGTTAAAPQLPAANTTPVRYDTNTSQGDLYDSINSEAVAQQREPVRGSVSQGVVGLWEVRGLYQERPFHQAQGAGVACQMVNCPRVFR